MRCAIQNIDRSLQDGKLLTLFSYIPLPSFKDFGSPSNDLRSDQVPSSVYLPTLLERA